MTDKRQMLERLTRALDGVFSEEGDDAEPSDEELDEAAKDLVIDVKDMAARIRRMIAAYDVREGGGGS